MDLSKLNAYASLSAAMIIVGSSVVFGKVITQVFPVFLASGLRFALASLILFPILLKSENNISGLSAKEIKNLLFMAFCGQVVFTFLVLLGLRYTSAVEAGIITSTSPAMMAMVSYLFFREKPGISGMLAIACVIIGIVSVNGFWGQVSSESGEDHLLGNVLMIGAVLGEAFFLLMRKRISPEISNLKLTCYLCFTGFFMFLPFSIWQGIFFDFSSVSVGAWLCMLYFGAVFTVLAYLFWFNGVSKVSGNVAGMFTAVMPVSAVVLSCTFLDEPFEAHHAVGTVLIIGSIFLMTFGNNE